MIPIPTSAIAILKIWTMTGSDLGNMYKSVYFKEVLLPTVMNRHFGMLHHIAEVNSEIQRGLWVLFLILCHVLEIWNLLVGCN